MTLPQMDSHIVEKNIEIIENIGRHQWSAMVINEINVFLPMLAVPTGRKEVLHNEPADKKTAQGPGPHTDGVCCTNWLYSKCCNRL